MSGISRWNAWSDRIWIAQLLACCALVCLGLIVYIVTQSRITPNVHALIEVAKSFGIAAAIFALFFYTARFVKNLMLWLKLKEILKPPKLTHYSKFWGRDIEERFSFSQMEPYAESYFRNLSDSVFQAIICGKQESKIQALKDELHFFWKLCQECGYNFDGHHRGFTERLKQYKEMYA